jgi:hypothetical protein
VNGGDGIQIQRVAANILNEKSWTADKRVVIWLEGSALTKPSPHHNKAAYY